MTIPNRSRDKDGEWREKRADTKVENLKQDYPEFRNINGNTKLGTLKDRFGVDSLDEVRRALRKHNN
jgi:hypothetical protein